MKIKKGDVEKKKNKKTLRELERKMTRIEDDDDDNEDEEG